MPSYSHTSATFDLMRRAPVIPVLTIDDVANGLALAKALVAGGLHVLEITLRTPNAMAAIREIANALPGAIVGAGTIVEPAQIEAAVRNGALFLVSPGMTPRLLPAACGSPVPLLPGAATASEAMHLMDNGFFAQKFFPAEAAGGVRMLSSLSGPLGDLRFCPTGGIDAAKAPSYLALKNVLCVGGSWMAPPDALRAGDYVRIEALAREAAALARRPA